MSNRAKSMLARTKRIATMLAVSCLLAGAGSVAQADEFMLLGSNGAPRGNERVTVLNEQDQPLQVLYTDDLGRFSFPYRGTVETYHFRVGDNGNTGSFLVTGAQGMRPVNEP